MIETCYFCGAHTASGEVEVWSLPDAGVDFKVARSTSATACVETTVGELWICERCYRKNVFRVLRSEDRAAVHYQMGLEYSYLERHEESIAALRKAVRLKRNADVMASLAKSYSDIGDVKRAYRYYRAALANDPGHFMSKENIKNLPHSNSSKDNWRRR